MIQRSHPSRLSRRSFLQTGLTLSGGAALGLLKPVVSAAESQVYLQLSLEEALALSPLEAAKKSVPVVSAWNSVVNLTQSLRSDDVRRRTLDALINPAPTILATGNAIVDYAFPPAESTERMPQSFLSAPGGGYSSHHAYPGGLAVHSASTARLALAHVEVYRELYGVAPDRDLIIAACLLHDLHKPWVFQWLEDGSCRSESQLLGAGEHHVLSIAECLHRGLPAEVVIGVACAQASPGNERQEKKIAEWLKTAAALAGVDARRKGLLDADDRLPRPLRMEWFLCNLGDNDWRYTVPAASEAVQALKRIAPKLYGLAPDSAEFNRLRNVVFAQATQVRAAHVLQAAGEDGFIQLISSLVTPRQA